MNHRRPLAIALALGLVFASTSRLLAQYPRRGGAATGRAPRASAQAQPIQLSRASEATYQRLNRLSDILPEEPSPYAPARPAPAPPVMDRLPRTRTVASYYPGLRSGQHSHCVGARHGFAGR